MEQILPTLKAANTVRVDENIKASIERVVKQLGDDVAETFAKKVRTVLDDVDDVSRRVSLPANLACVFGIIVTFAIMLLVLVIYANMMFVHSGVLWAILGCGFGLEVFVWLLVWYLRRKGWV